MDETSRRIYSHPIQFINYSDVQMPLSNNVEIGIHKKVVSEKGAHTVHDGVNLTLSELS